MATSSVQQPVPATLIPGDGIGPEISAAVVTILDALGAPFAWETQEGGMSAARNSGDPLPAALLDSIRRTKLALKGPLATPVGGGYRSVNVRLREEFRLYANLRPARTLIAGGRYEDIDLVLVRENLEGLYVGFEHYIPIDGDPNAVAIASGVNTRAGSRRIAEFAFDYAVRNGRKKVTIVHKANVLKALTGIFLETAQDVARKYEGRIAVDERIVDACAMQLVLNPWQFDVIVTTNLFGDILSDEIAGWSAALAWRRAPISAKALRSSKRSMAPRPTLRARDREPARVAARGSTHARARRQGRHGRTPAPGNRPDASRRRCAHR
jgi:isocitrate dehydrogenase (NAD+)